MRSFSTRGASLLSLLVAALVVLFTAPNASAAPAAPAAVPGIPLTGTFTDATGGTGTASGTFTPSQFIADGDRLLAEGVADVTLVDSTGQIVGTGHGPSNCRSTPPRSPHRARSSTWSSVPSISTCWAWSYTSTACT